MLIFNTKPDEEYVGEVVNIRSSEYDVFIGRGSKYGNPYTHIKDRPTGAKYIVSSREEAIQRYEEYIRDGEGKYLLESLIELKGKRLGCYCHPKSCHGDILIKLIKELNI